MNSLTWKLTSCFWQLSCILYVPLISVLDIFRTKIFGFYMLTERRKRNERMMTSNYFTGSFLLQVCWSKKCSNLDGYVMWFAGYSTLLGKGVTLLQCSFDLIFVINFISRTLSTYDFVAMSRILHRVILLMPVYVGKSHLLHFVSASKRFRPEKSLLSLLTWID